MDLKPPARMALGDSVANILRNAILDGSLRPGDPLHENVLTQQLSVSRSPIREALLQLEQERLVDSRPNRSAVVRKPSPEEIRQVYTIRSALEGIAARWAAEKATPALVAGLRRRADDLNDATIASEAGDDPAVLGKAIDFHAAVAEAAGSAELHRLLESLRNQIKHVMVVGLATLTSRRAGEIHAEHLALIDAIAERDGDRAERLASAHVRGARDRLVAEADGTD
ncbi:GntR family transcriptional regulator [Bradyrhizobium sp. LTSPM299]|uniref:GntR family transcriptional regulator n=1 Tax=Bradyrhizobium sp. LTSPM299 TaxID=1619233 RepID=UPI0005CB5F06|nr:GntR family transcriptional regulator [Bradyrhizobium sp. LTSPM299]